MTIKSQVMTTKTSAVTVMLYQLADMNMTIETTVTSESPLSASSFKRWVDYCRMPTLPEQ